MVLGRLGSFRRFGKSFVGTQSRKQGRNDRKRRRGSVGWMVRYYTRGYPTVERRLQTTRSGFSERQLGGGAREWERILVEELDKLGWKAGTSLRDGIRLAYEDFLKQQAAAATAP